MKFLSMIFALLFSVSAFALTAHETKLNQWAKSKGELSQRLEKLYQIQWEYMMHSYPEWATYDGYPGLNDQLTDFSMQAIERRKGETRFLQKILNSLPANKLKGEHLVTFELFKYRIDRDVESYQFPQELIPIHQMEGIQQGLSDTMEAAPTQTLKDYKDRIERLRKVPVQIDQTIALMQEGMKRKVLPPKVVLSSVPQQFEKMAQTDLQKNPLFQNFKEIKAPLNEAQKQELQKEAQKVILDQVVPAFQKLSQFFTSTYLPACRTSIAWKDLPDGIRWYNYLVKHHTTTDFTAEQVHEIGLKEVARIRTEMDKIREKVAFKGSLKEFDRMLLTDPKFVHSSAANLMIGYRDIAKRIDFELPRLFGKLPRLPYGVREMPDFKAPSAPTAYYQGGSLESGRAGFFEANTYDLKSRQMWQMEALTLHEAVPGHHLQIALAQEMEGLPKFRKEMGFTAFSEGWGLYAESLGEELGMYKDPYSKYGQLAYEMWRSIRLVVDTGLHTKGWTRDQVMQYFRDNGPFPEVQIVAETDRYIVMAGQALAYKIGELKFQDLKKRARTELGDRFNIRRFHDELLGSGALPMEVIEKKMQTWIAKQASAATNKPSSNR